MLLCPVPVWAGQRELEWQRGNGVQPAFVGNAWETSRSWLKSACWCSIQDDDLPGKGNLSARGWWGTQLWAGDEATQMLFSDISQQYGVNTLQALWKTQYLALERARIWISASEVLREVAVTSRGPWVARCVKKYVPCYHSIHSLWPGREKGELESSEPDSGLQSLQLLKKWGSQFMPALGKG